MNKIYDSSIMSLSYYKALNRNKRDEYVIKLAKEYSQNTTSNTRKLQIERLLTAIAELHGRNMLNKINSITQQQANANLIASALADENEYSKTDKKHLIHGGKYCQQTRFKRRHVSTKKRKSLRSK
jgi:hypothetical protein